jgi:hypothetical protein
VQTKRRPDPKHERGAALATLVPYDLGGGVRYTHHPDHRNRTGGKSQWRISLPKERQAFITARAEGWLIRSTGWGLHVDNTEPAYLGVAQDHVTRVFVSKFVDGNQSQNWHGYPADHQRNPQDIPDADVLKIWMDNDLIPLSKIRKLVKGQPCTL